MNTLYKVYNDPNVVSSIGIATCPLCQAPFDTLHPQAAWHEINEKMVRICPICSNPN